MKINNSSLPNTLVTINKILLKDGFSSTILILVGLIYLLPSLKTPFIGDNDYWSNLLPVIHFRNSILNEHVFPTFTELWYGGRAQWQNPLWSFFYLPSTIIWLILPLDWGARVIVTLHVIFSLLVGKQLSSLFIPSPVGRITTSIILVAPLLPALLAGHLEKIMAWGWVLLALYLLLDEKRSLIRRGTYSGLCLGTIALIGANYYVLYTGIILIPLAISFRKWKIVIGLFMGALTGLLHLPSVWYLVGHIRGSSAIAVDYFSTDLLGVFTSLASGYAKPYGWESWALIGLPVVYLFFRSIILQIHDFFKNKSRLINPQKIAILFSLAVLILFSTGFIYKGHHLFDTFRVPVRAIAFVALATVLYLLIDTSGHLSEHPKSENHRVFLIFLITSVFQISIMSMIHLRPPGSVHSPYDTEVQALAGILRADKAQSVWVTNLNVREKVSDPKSFQESTLEFQDTYIEVVLADNGFALPNVYYGDMGQTIPIEGPYCGYSFDHVIATMGDNDIELVSKLSHQKMGIIPKNKLRLVGRSMIEETIVYIYRIVCE